MPKAHFNRKDCEQEISLLITSDAHENVLRYYAMEEDHMHLYLALERCTGHLAALVDSSADGSTSSSSSRSTRAISSSSNPDPSNAVLSDKPSLAPSKQQVLDFMTKESTVAGSEARVVAWNQNSRAMVRASSEPDTGAYVLDRLPLQVLLSLGNKGSSLADAGDPTLGSNAFALGEVDAVSVLRGMVNGIAHLHRLNIVHRDIKPQNMLVTSKGTVKIADMGLSKQLEAHRSSYDSRIAGSAGWQAPEVIRAIERQHDNAAECKEAGLRLQKLTRAVDTFSMGCVIFFVLTGGNHPFGRKSAQREARILSGQYDLQPLYDSLSRAGVCPAIAEMAAHLVESLICAEPEKRLTAAQALDHPLFWSDERRLLFLEEVSDRVEIASAELMDPLRTALEAGVQSVVGADWRARLDTGLLDNLVKYRKYESNSIRDLLRVIRNKRHHYRDLPADVQQLLGPLPSGFLSYFLCRFPRLLLHAYKAVQQHPDGSAAPASGTATPVSTPLPAESKRAGSTAGLSPHPAGATPAPGARAPISFAAAVKASPNIRPATSVAGAVPARAVPSIPIVADRDDEGDDQQQGAPLPQTKPKNRRRGRGGKTLAAAMSPPGNGAAPESGAHVSAAAASTVTVSPLPRRNLTAAASASSNLSGRPSPRPVGRSNVASWRGADADATTAADDAPSPQSSHDRDNDVTAPMSDASGASANGWVKVRD